MSKSKLERAIESHADGFNDAQRELVMSQLRDYKRNSSRISRIDETLKAMDMQPVAGPDGVKVHLAQRVALSDERAKLVNVNGAIAARLFEQMGDR